MLASNRAIAGVVALWVAVIAATVACVSPAHAGSADTMDLGFETERLGPREAEAAWIVTTPGWFAERAADAKRKGTVGAVIRSEHGARGTGILARTLDATPFRGKRVAYRADVKVEGAGRVQAWMRVDRPNNQAGAFDNMHDRPLLLGDWRRVEIKLDVAADATSIALGFLVGPETAAFIDDVTLETVGDAVGTQPPSAPGPLEGRALENVRAASKLLGYLRFFHPSDQVRGVKDWGRVAIATLEAAEPATDATDLAARLAAVTAPLAPTVRVWVTGADAPEPPATMSGATKVVAWKHTGAGLVSNAAGNIYRSEIVTTPLAGDASFPNAFVDVALDGGVTARIPVLVFADEKGTLPNGATPAEFSGANPLPTLTALNRSTRLASVALAWAVFQHFYPYFDVVDCDWDRALTEALQAAALDADEAAFLETLQVLVAALHDGHGNVYRQGGSIGALPLALTWAGDDLVVVGSCGDADGAVNVGDRIVSIGGRTPAECHARAARRISHATDGWARALSPALIVRDVQGDAPVPIALRRPDGTEYSLALAPTERCAAMDRRPPRPADGTELAPGIVYFNLDGAESSALQAAMPKLLAAKGIVFDMRGYPAQAAYEVLERLLRAPGTSARWMVPIVTRPDRAGVTWTTSSWRMAPKTPALPSSNVVFLTDGRAISYAESIMGIVEAYKLGEIVGDTTAGTNGNVNPFEVPGGYHISWTGMKVLKHDGSRHHGVGIAPTVKVVPTAAGIAAGRDEVLEKGVEIAAAKVGATK